MMTESDGGADAERAGAEMSPAELQLAGAAKAAIAKILSASPQKRVQKIIEWAVGYECASDEARMAVASQLTAFAHDAADFLERGDFGGLQMAIGDFNTRVKTVAAIAQPAPEIMPALDSDVWRAHGWKPVEVHALREVLCRPLYGVKRGDCVVKIDADGATLASGRRLARAVEIANANTPEWLAEMQRG
jgi:hypothetical protein